MKKLFLLALLCAVSVEAKDIVADTAVLRTMDKITGRVQKIEVGIGEQVQVGTLTILVEKCLKKPPEETPENAAFLTITDEDAPQKPVFHGWMFSSNPALSAMEHPVYDIWVVDCGEEIAAEMPIVGMPQMPITEEADKDELIED